MNISRPEKDGRSEQLRILHDKKRFMLSWSSVQMVKSRRLTWAVKE
jgi:hypothetical protein